MTSNPVRIIRARLAAYDAQAHTADVAPILGPAALISDVPVLSFCPAEDLTEDVTIAVVLWPDGSALVLGPYEPPA